LVQKVTKRYLLCPIGCFCQVLAQNPMTCEGMNGLKPSLPRWTFSPG
jgi:hypothetical protein